MADWNIGIIAHGLGDGSNWANRQAWSQTNTQAAIDQLVAGDVLRIEKSNYSPSATFDCDINSGTPTGTIDIIFVDSDGNDTGDFVELDGGSSIANCFKITKNYWNIYNCHGKNYTSVTFSSSTGSYRNLYNCKSSNSGASGFQGGTNDKAENCEATGATNGFYLYTHLYNCLSHTNTTGSHSTKGCIKSGTYYNKTA